MRRHGNDPSRIHTAALRELLTGFTHQALGIDAGRFAYAMPCGAGKTLGMIVWLASAWKLGIRISVAVSASQIEALCKIKDALIEYGVPEAIIGVRHSYGAAARHPDTGDDDRPIMLVSHERIRRGRDHGLFCRHLGIARDLLIWDESLIAAETTSLALTSASVAARGVLSVLPPASPLRVALARDLTVLNAEAGRLRSDPAATPATLELLRGVDLQAARAELLGLRGRDRMQHAAIETVKDYLQLAQRPVAIAVPAAGDSNDGLIHYSPVIDPELTNIAVLDASFPIRLLARGGNLVSRTTPAMRQCKRYERVYVHLARVGAGRRGWGKGKKWDGKTERELVRLTVEAVRKTPQGDPILVFTFKDAPTHALKEGLTRAGIDLAEQIAVNGVLRPRISWLTWGRETSLNEYGHCKHVILVGVLRRSHLDLAACKAGLLDSINHRAKKQELSELALSEMAHCVLQAMNRGACRRVDAEGQAHAMNLTIFAYAPGLKGALDECLPGVEWVEEIPASAGSRTAHLTQKVAAYLDGLSPDMVSISVNKLKGAVKSDLGADAWSTAIQGALKGPAGWCQPKGSRSLIRKHAA